MKQQLTADAMKKAQEEASAEVSALRDELNEKSQKVKDSQKRELEFAREKRQLQERLEQFDLEVEKRLISERSQIKQDVEKNVSDAYKLKERELQMKIDSMSEQIDDLKRKAEQGSPRDRGEVMELELEDILRNSFPNDVIKPVAKGVRGADVLQDVFEQGQHCGTIIWESKRTKAWSDGWLSKLKDDQREAGAEVAVLMSLVLPKDVESCACLNNIWVTCYDFAIPLASALRAGLGQTARARKASENRGEKMEMLYGYLSGPEFRQRVEAIVEAFATMKTDLDKEKRAIMKAWSKREKQIERVMRSTVGMYGDMQGIIGSSLPELREMEMKALAENGDEEDADDLKEKASV
ncbi:MAG TPA: DUF2130 domain-containing protein [Deltaproteobacteria bacterium]|nr:DUF2130 domain-containing protein [Deltaproteobacteria bacterium]